jgi:hypothetical protein
MRVIRPAEDANTILGTARQRIHPKFEKFTAANAEFKCDLEHQPIAQSCVG